MEDQIYTDLYWSTLPLLIIQTMLISTIVVFAFSRKLRLSREEVLSLGDSVPLPSFIREWWFWFNRPILRFFIRNNISANAVTTLSLFLAAISGYLFHLGQIGAAGWMMILSGTCDFIDGKIARATKTETKSGAFYDSTLDRISETFTFLGLISYFRDGWMLWFTLLAYIGSMMVSYTRARSEGLGIPFYKGFMQRPERMVYISVGAIFSPILVFIYYEWLGPVHYLVMFELILIGIMSNVVVLIRTIDIMRKKYK